jgi:hypothetical protein
MLIHKHQLDSKRSMQKLSSVQGQGLHEKLKINWKKRPQHNFAIVEMIVLMLAVPRHRWIWSGLRFSYGSVIPKPTGLSGIEVK